MKKLLAISLLFLITCSVNAQQYQHYSQYLFNMYALNPGYGGSNSFFEGKMNTRYQWTGITDAPRTYIMTLNGPLNNEKMGVGGTIYTDIVGPTRRTELMLSYAYHLKLNETIKLGLGLGGGVMQFAVDGSKLTTQDPDIAVSNALQSVIIPDATFGAYLYHEKFFVSLSAPQLIPFKLQFFKDYPETKSRLANHFYAAAGYTYDINDDFAVQPSVLVKYVSPVPLQIDGSLKISYKNMIWLAGTYRTLDAISIMAGYTFQDNISIGYSYDITTSGLKQYSGGTHELMLSIKFKDKTIVPESEASIE